MPMISLEEALAIVDRHVAGRATGIETVPVREAHGRILAEAARSCVSLPPFDKSAMDGYAVMADDERETYRVLEKIPAGSVPTRSLTPGTTAKVMTGAPVPVGAGRVIMVEDTDGGEDTVRVSRHADATNICLLGEDINSGEVVFPAGRKLDAVAVANLISCGVASVQVHERVRLAILSTGSEIVSSPDELAPGRIMDSNGPMLAGLAAEYEMEVVMSRHSEDDAAALAEAIEQMASAADVVLVSGGVSMGDFDLVPVALRATGFVIHFDRVAVKPGRPATFAVRPDSIALGMPGNPVATFLGFHLYVRRIAARLCGGEPPVRSCEMGLAAEYRRKRGGRASLRPCVINDSGQLEPLPYHGSAHLLAVAGADGFFLVPRAVTHIAAGEHVRFYALAPARW